MDLGKHSKNIVANLQFLKRFEGKKTIITKDGLISSLQSQYNTPVSISSNNQNKQPKSIKQQLKIVKNQSSKLVNTEPSTKYQLSIERYQIGNNNIVIPDIKRTQRGSKHSNRSQIPKLTDIKQRNEVFFNQDHRINSSGKLPRLTKSKSDRNMDRKIGIFNFAQQSISRRQSTGRSLSNYQLQLKNDISASKYFQQLQKFQASLRNLKMKTNSKIHKI